MLCVDIPEVVIFMSKCYSELIQIPTFEERLEYLRTYSLVGGVTFGYERYLNQVLYKCPEWKALRPHIITRDNGCDLAIRGLDIKDEPIIVHHIIPVTVEMILDHDPLVFDPENLIICRDITHKVIHYAISFVAPIAPIERRPNDTCPWRK